MYIHLIINSFFSILSSFIFIILIDKKYNRTKSSLIVIFSIFYFLQFLSMATIMHDMNYAFITNLFDFTNYQVAFSIYRKYSLIATIVILLAVVILILIKDKMNIKNKYIRYSIMSICFIYILTPYSLVHRFLRVCYSINNDKSYTKTYKELFKDINGENYVDASDLSVEYTNGRKNLVFIIIESYEQKLLEGKYTTLSKDITSYSNNSEFFSDINMIEGSGWTIAGIHTMLCGSPRIYSISSNRLFKTVKINKMICLSDVLNKAGYYQLYISGERKTFSGKSQFLEMHKYDKILGKKELSKKYNIRKENYCVWGIKDTDLFEIAKDKYLKLSELKRPFNLTITTLASHFPTGISDDKCKNSTNNTMLNAIECTNDLIADFIEFIKQQPNYRDTIIVLIPDHLMMSSVITDDLGDINTRKLYSMILNTGKISKEKNTILYTDMPDIILNRLGIKHNAKFLLGNYKNQTTKERINFINNNLNKIRAFNNKTIMQE